ncbi:MAG TPA: M15 family metallopeptidase [Polyangiaceae bacterium]|jgi:hypothetical protein|nr:M15 family metallopeptidase [Polyangiaceae bacterium]
MSAHRTPVFPRLIVIAIAACAAPLAFGCSAAPDELSEAAQETDGLEPTGEREDEVGTSTVASAVTSSCATSSVKGLSLQIIAEGKCISPGAYVKVPDLDNISFGPNVFPYLEKPARDKLVAALKANPGKSLSVNSMLRTVAQQYLLYRWGKLGRCGIGLAATPGNSNHETGLAMDVNEYTSWKTTLANHGFKWFGNADKVHFDYVGSGAKSYKGIDVLAFQRLWNRNNPGDKISADGEWGPNTEARMKKAPAAGFAKGAECNAAFSDEPPVEEGAAPEPVAECAEAAHDVCVEGAALTACQNACADAVCAADNFCCTNSWDALCVEQASSEANATACGCAAAADHHDDEGGEHAH